MAGKADALLGLFDWREADDRAYRAIADHPYAAAVRKGKFRYRVPAGEGRLPQGSELPEYWGARATPDAEGIIAENAFAAIREAPGTEEAALAKSYLDKFAENQRARAGFSDSAAAGIGLMRRGYAGFNTLAPSPVGQGFRR